MNKFFSFKISICLALIIVSSFHYLLQGQIINWDLIDTNTAVPVEGKINGLNMGGYTYGLINLQGEENSFPNECVQCLDFDCGQSSIPNPDIEGFSFLSMETKPAVVTKTAALKPSILRFPGGTHSGWYHFYRYDDNGLYDASQPEIDKGYGMNVGETVHLPNPYSYCQADSRLVSSQNYIDGFINYMKNIQDATGSGTKIEIAYVVNLLTHFKFDQVNLLCMQTCGRWFTLNSMDNYNCSESFEYSYEGNEALFDDNPNVYRFELYYKETQDAINHLVTNLELQKEDVIYVEMGNEYYDNDGFTSGYNKYGINANDYAELVEIYAERLKCFFEEKVTIKIGIVSKPGSHWQSSTNIFNHNFPGIKNLLDQDITNDGRTFNDAIDAVILHNYYTSSTCLDENDINDRFSCGKESMNNHIEGENGLKSGLDNFRNNFPDKEIWLTEWNLVGGTDNKNIDYMNTPLHASFVLEYALSLLEYNASYNNVVKMAMHHRIGGEHQWSVIQTKDGDNETAIKRASGYAMQYLSKLYDYDNYSFIGNILMEDESTFDLKEAKTMAFLQAADQHHADDRILIYFSNKTSEDIPFTIPTEIGGIQVMNAQISYLRGDHPFSHGPSNGTHGRNVFKDDTTAYYEEELNNLGFGLLHNQLTNEFELALDLSEEHILPANSIGVLEISERVTDLSSIKETGIKLEVYPNPSHQNLNIEILSDQQQDIVIELVDINGQKKSIQNHLLFTGKNILPISISGLSNGVYFLTVQMDDHIFTRKFIKV